MELNGINSMDEQWYIKGKYSANREGKIFSYVSGERKERKQSLIQNGYLGIELRIDGKRCFSVAHKVIWETFNGKIPDGMQINHINEDKRDNRLENLELVTPSENVNFGSRNKRVAAKLKGGHLNAIKAVTKGKYTSAKIILEDALTHERTEYESMKAAAIKLGYKSLNAIKNYIYTAERKGRNFIKVKGKKYIFYRGNKNSIIDIRKKDALIY